MAQSLVKRFQGREKEVLEYTERYGRSNASSHFECDYIAFNRLIDKLASPDFGQVAKYQHISTSGNNTILDAFVRTFAEYVVRTDHEIDLLKKENERLREITGYFQANESERAEERISHVMQDMKELITARR